MALKIEWYEGHITAKSVIDIRSHMNSARANMQGRVLELPEGCGVYLHEHVERFFGFEIRTSQDLEPNTFRAYHRAEFKFE